MVLKGVLEVSHGNDSLMVSTERLHGINHGKEAYHDRMSLVREEAKGLNGETIPHGVKSTGSVERSE
jgi:hypothetical protein